MLGIVVNLPPAIEHFFAVTSPDVLAAYALLIVGPIPILGVIIWGFSHLWLDYKQEVAEHHLKWVNLEVRVPQTSIQTPKGMENFFSNLAGAKSGITWRETWLLGKVQARFSFEIISNGGDISFVIRAQDKFRDILEADLYAQYPEAQILEVPDYTGLISKKYPNDDQELFGGELVLGKPNYLPLRTYEEFEHQGEKENRFKDPLLSLLELMGKMQPGEHLWVQLIIRPPSSEDWVKEGLSYLAKVMGKEEKAPKKGGILSAIDDLFWFPFGVIEQVSGLKLGGGAEKAEKKPDDFKMFRLTSAEKMQIDAVAEKISKVGWQAKIRWVGVGPKNKFRKGVFASGMKGAFQPFNSPILNQLAMHGPSVPKDDYLWQKWSYAKKQGILARRFASRSMGAGATPCILNAEELATIFHFPSADARTPVLTAMGARRSEAPNTLPSAPLPRLGAETNSVVGEPTADDWRRVYLERRTHHGTTHALPTEIPHKPEVPHYTQAALPHESQYVAQDKDSHAANASRAVGFQEVPELVVPHPSSFQSSREALLQSGAGGTHDDAPPDNLPL